MWFPIWKRICREAILSTRYIREFTELGACNRRNLELGIEGFLLTKSELQGVFQKRRWSIIPSIASCTMIANVSKLCKVVIPPEQDWKRKLVVCSVWWLFIWFRNPEYAYCVCRMYVWFKFDRVLVLKGPEFQLHTTAHCLIILVSCCLLSPESLSSGFWDRAWALSMQGFMTCQNEVEFSFMKISHWLIWSNTGI